MSDEAALLAAIAEHPDEDTPRLAYADWLDEHDRHVRAEFIRVQIEIARKETLPRVLQNRHIDLWKRNQQLLDDHRDEFLGPLAGFGVTVEFRRGFVSELVLRCGALEAHGGAVRALRPTPRLVVEDAVWSVRAFLGPRYPNAPRDLVAAIRTRENKGGDDDILFGAGPPDIRPHAWPRLEQLDIAGCRLGDEAFTTLIRSAALPTLSDLDASVNDLTDAGVSGLLDSGLPRNLRRVILGGNPLSDLSAFELAGRWPRNTADRLEHLNLRFTNIGTAGQQPLLSRFGGKLDLF